MAEDRTHKLAEKFQKGLDEGYPIEQIKMLAKEQGFDETVIKEVIEILNKPQQEINNESKVPQPYSLGAKMIFWLTWLLILGLFILGAGCGLVGLEYFSAAAPFGILFVASSLCLLLFLLVIAIRKLKQRKTLIWKICLILVGGGILATFIYLAGCALTT